MQLQESFQYKGGTLTNLYHCFVFFFVLSLRNPSFVVHFLKGPGVMFILNVNKNVTRWSLFTTL